jgi:Ankyrin repeats (3 copies)
MSAYRTCFFLGFPLLIASLCHVARADANKDLVKAVEKKNGSQIEKAIRKGASLEATASDGTPILALAARECNKWIVELLVSKGASVQAQGTAAWNAASGCRCRDGITDFLIEKGLPLPTPGTDPCGRTPLMVASQAGRTDIVKKLLESGTSPDVKDADGATAIYYAAYSGQIAVEKMLVELGRAVPLIIATVKDEREVYVWHSPPSSGIAQSRWNVSGSLGKGDLSTGTPIDPEIFLIEAASDPGPAPGFDVWYFAPQNSTDHLTLESGPLNCCQQSLRGPITFIGLVDSPTGGAFWSTLPNTLGGFVRLFTALYPGPSGALVLGGGVFLYQGGARIMTLPTAPVSVTGTIRFPGNGWAVAKKGFKIKGGGLQFDETGVFLMPGTQYLREAR